VDRLVTDLAPRERLLGPDALVVAELTFMLLRASVTPAGVDPAEFRFLVPPGTEELGAGEAFERILHTPKPLTAVATRLGNVVSIHLRQPTEVELDILRDSEARFDRTLRHLLATAALGDRVLVHSSTDTLTVSVSQYRDWIGTVFCPECSFSLFPPSASQPADVVAVVRFQSW